jgi:hypothetical protein
MAVTAAGKLGLHICHGNGHDLNKGKGWLDHSSKGACVWCWGGGGGVGPNGGKC